MKNRKRILPMFLALVLILGIMVIPASAAETVAPIEWRTIPDGSLANGGKSYPVFSDESVAEDWLYRTKEGRAWVESVLDDPFLCILDIGPENRFDGIFYVCKTDEVNKHGYPIAKSNNIPLDEARAKLDENKDNIIATSEPVETSKPVATPEPVKPEFGWTDSTTINVHMPDGSWQLMTLAELKAMRATDKAKAAEDEAEANTVTAVEAEATPSTSIFPDVPDNTWYTEAVPYKYDQVRDFYQGLAAVELDGKWGRIDTTGKEVVPCKYDWVYDFSEDLAAVRIGDWGTEKYGFIDRTGNEVVPCKYDGILVDNMTGFAGFSEGLAAVRNGSWETGKWGFIDTTGKEVVPCKYAKVWNFNQGLAAVEQEGKDRWGNTIFKWGFIDATGQEVVPCKYDGVLDDKLAGFAGFSEGLAAVRMGDSGNEKWGFIDTTGKEVVPCKYSQVSYTGFSDGLAAVCIGKSPNEKWGFIDTTGKEVIPCKYKVQVDDLTGFAGFSEGLAVVGNENWKTGFIDTTGKEVVPCKYIRAEDFDQGLAAVANENGWGFIDTTGKEVVPCKYDRVEDFSEGLAAVGEGPYLNYKWGIVDTTGREVVPCKYSNVSWNPPEFHEGLAAVCNENHQWGFIDATGKEVVPCQYGGVGDFSEGLAAVRLNGKRGFIDTTGNEVVPCKYDEVGNFDQGLAAVKLDGKWGFLAIDGYTEPTQSIPAANTAYASTQTVNVDGKAVTFECYALKDANGNATNYIKLRDLALLLNGSAAQFQVGWDGSVTITTKTAYTPNGSELSTPYSGDRAYQETNAATKVNGVAADLAAFVLNDDQGGGYTYYQLRDLGKALGFNVGWAADKGIFVETDKPYDANN